MTSCIPVMIIIIFITTTFISACIYGLFRNPGEPTAMSDEDYKREAEHRNNPIKEIKIYLTIWAITFIIVSSIFFILRNPC